MKIYNHLEIWEDAIDKLNRGVIPEHMAVFGDPEYVGIYIGSPIAIINICPNESVLLDNLWLNNRSEKTMAISINEIVPKFESEKSKI